MNPLTLSTWDSAEAGRRNYPRVKRNIVEAWKFIQMSRLEWEFNNVEINTVIYPRFKVVEGTSTSAIFPGDVFEGQESGFQFTVRATYNVDGDWGSGQGEAQLEFETYTGDRPKLGERFTQVSGAPGTSMFTYAGRGSYDLKEVNPFAREVIGGTAVAQYSNYAPTNVVSIPWDNWLYKQMNYASNGTQSPAFMSQDYEGKIVFYPQSPAPFRFYVIVSTGPQVLSLPSDVPARIPEEFHEWISWEAMESVALYDKNPDLLAFARKWTTFYRGRAERSLMPQPSWGSSRYSFGVGYGADE